MKDTVFWGAFAKVRRLLVKLNRYLGALYTHVVTHLYTFSVMVHQVFNQWLQPY
jgi:hypothetical protein